MNKYNFTSTVEDFSVGDSISWNINFDNFKSSDNYNLSFVFVNRTNKFSLDTTPETDGSFSLVKTGAETEIMVSGKYLMFFVITRDSDSFTKQLENGYLNIAENVILVPELDTRTHAQKVLDSINSLIEGKVLDDVSNYTIAGRQLMKYNFKELTYLRDYYKAEVERDNIKEDIKEKGYSNRNKLKVVFNPYWKR